MTNLDYLDWIVLFGYAIIVVYIGVRAGRGERDLSDYFLGGRRMPWWAVMISIYATSLSALTFIGVPGAAFVGDFHFLQFGIGDLIGRVLIAFVFLTRYYEHGVTTVYQFLGYRFGHRTHDAGVGFFIVTRLLASSVRLAGCAIALSVVFNLPLNTTIVVITMMALAYTLSGGIKAVIWTDALQFVLFIGAALTALIVIVAALPNQWQDFIEIGTASRKFTIFHLSLDAGHPDYWLNISNPKSLIAGVVFGCLTTLAALGTDQDLVQRMLTCRNVVDGQKALLLTIALNFPVTLLFLSVGAALFIYYQTFPDSAVNHFVEMREADKIFPYFIRSVIPAGLRGLLIAGLLAAAMSSLDSALNALASTVYVDIYERYAKVASDNVSAVRISRLFVFIFGIALAGLAMLFSYAESILWVGFRIVGYTYGAMLGVFMLAVITKERGADRINVAAMLTSVLIVVFLTAEHLGTSMASLRAWVLAPLAIDRIAWPWAICIGTSWTLGVSILFKSHRFGK